MMEEQLITFETAKLAKEKGFDWIKSDNKWYEDNGNLDFSFQGYHENTENKITAPTQSLLQKWLRDEHNEHINVTYMVETKTYNSSLTLRSMGWSGFKTYEDGLEKGLYKALKLI